MEVLKECAHFFLSFLTSPGLHRYDHHNKNLIVVDVSEFVTNDINKRFDTRN